jgi:hypothetical protein
MEEYRTSHFGSDGTASSFAEGLIARGIAHFEVFRELFTAPTSQEQLRSEDSNRLSSVRLSSRGVNQCFSLDVKDSPRDGCQRDFRLNNPFRCKW